VKKYSKEIKGNKLSEFIALSGIDKKKLAKMIGLKSEDAITRWEIGESMPKVKYLLLLSVILKTKIQNMYPDLYTQAVKEVPANKKVAGGK